MDSDMFIRVRTVGKCDVCGKSGTTVEYSLRLTKLCLCSECLGKGISKLMMADKKD